MHIFLIILFAIIFIVIAITKFKIHPFITLVLTSIISGFLIGLDTNTIIDKINEGFGNTLSSIGIIIALGAIIGTFLEKSGATSALAKYVVGLMGERKSPLAMNLTGFLISIPVFCDAGFIILSSINKALSKKTGISLVVFAVALSTGLYVSHVFIPPTPGPLAAAEALKADLGLVILWGIIIGIPTALVGYLWAIKSGKTLIADETKVLSSNQIKESNANALSIFAPIIIPIVFIAMGSVAKYPSFPFGQGALFEILVFLGHPLVALFIGILFSLRLVDKKINRSTRLDWVTDSLKEAGIIILITGAGGAFGNILKSSNLGEILGSQLSEVHVGIFLPFILAAILKIAQGSSTVAIITTATIISPLMGSLGLESELSRTFTVLAIGAGSMTVSHINDSYFWVVSQFSGMDTKTTLKSHTLATFFQGITAITLLFVLQIIFR